MPAHKSSSVWLTVVLLAGCVGGAPESNLTAQATRVGYRYVDRPGLSHAPAPNAGATAQYYGGSVTPNAKVYVVWWGPAANINSAVTAAKGGIADFYAGILNSTFMDWLNEYNTTGNATAGSHSGMAGTGQRIGRGNYAGTLTLTNIPSGNVTDAQIQTTLDAAIAAGTLPPPDDNTLYAIYFPSGLSITLDGSTSCSSFGAYHEAIIETQRHDTYYLVMPDCGSSFNGWTSVSTHELIEAVTDNVPAPGNSPNFPQAWNDAMGNEVGDLCEGNDATVSTPLGMFTVQAIWDERTHGCKAFSSDANDFNVAVSPNVATVALGATTTYTVQTATSAGTAQMLTLSATAPTGVTATVSPATISSGATATLTVTANNPSAASGLQVVVRGDATAGGTTQSHTAALLLSTTGMPPDLGAPPDLAQAPADLAQPSGGGGSGGTGDMATRGGTGGNGATGSHGCGCVVGARATALDGTWMQATLLALALALAISRRRRRA